MKITEKINLWRKVAREYTLSQSALPYLLSVLIASKNYQINYFLSFLGLIGVVFVQMAVNMLDDYFDWKNGSVKIYDKLIKKGYQVRSHKCFYLKSGIITLKQLLIVIISLISIAGLIEV